MAKIVSQLTEVYSKKNNHSIICYLYFTIDRCIQLHSSEYFECVNTLRCYFDNEISKIESGAFINLHVVPTNTDQHYTIITL